MDNRVFDINGKGALMLQKVIELACHQQRGCYDSHVDENSIKIAGYKISPKNGLILKWVCHPEKGDQKFLVPLKPADAIGMVMGWLETEEAKAIPPKDSWDGDCDHDGHNSIGWRACCEDWGHVDGDWGAIIAIRPTYLWHGK
jgi:hypothetical protein